MHAKQLAEGVTLDRKGKTVNPNRVAAQRGCHTIASTVGVGRGRLICIVLDSHASMKRIKSRTTLRLYFKANCYVSIYYQCIRR